MFGDINRATLMGNVTRDPDLRFTSNGSAVLNFSIATNRRYQQNDEWKDEASFHNIVVWRNAESLAKRIKKGTRIYVEGRIHTRSWDDADGKKQYKTEVNADRVILIARYEGGGDEDAGASSDEEPTTKSKSKNTEEEIDVDDLPF